MKTTHTILAFTFALTLVGSAVSRADIVQKEKIEKTLSFTGPSRDRVVAIDNLLGAITVTGYDGDQVRVTAQKTVRARSETKAQRAQQEVVLDITEEEDFIELYVDGPFRDNEKRRGEINWRGYDHQGYEVEYDFDVEVPRGCSVVLKTVLNGDIIVRSVEGDFEVKNVNGGIRMDNVRGSGEARTVNGPITLHFDANPRDDCRFSTINGEVRLYFQPTLSADFSLDTFNGEVFTDFEFESLPPKIYSAKEHNGNNVYKIGRLCRVRTGSGGPEITMDGFNGDMFILKN